MNGLHIAEYWYVIGIDKVLMFKGEQDYGNPAPTDQLGQRDGAFRWHCTGAND
jgi:hypothetical protein